MELKLHHFVWLSLLCCFANFAAGGTLLGFSIFNHAYKKRHVSVKVIDDWRDMAKELIYFSGGIMLAAMMSFWGVTKRRKRDFPYALVIIGIHAGIVAVGVYYTYTTWDMMDSKLPLSDETIFKTTRRVIAEGARKHHNPKWVPKWLDNIQNKSKICCGVRSFRDWNEFWRPSIQGIRDHVPRSCCRRRSGRGCYTDLTSIPYPDTTDNNIKIDSGCAPEINKYIHKIVDQSYKVLFICTTVFAGGLLAFIAEYAFLFFLRKKMPDKTLSTLISLRKPKPAGPTDWKSLRGLNFQSPSTQGVTISLKQKHQRQHHHRNDHRSGRTGSGAEIGPEDGSESGNNNNYNQSNDSLQTASVSSSMQTNATQSSQKSPNRQVYFDPAIYVPLNGSTASLPDKQQGGHIKNALGYIEKVDSGGADAEDSNYPFQYDTMNALEYPPLETLAPEFEITGAMQTDTIPEEDLFYGGEDAGSPPPSSGPPAGSNNTSPGESSGEENVGRHGHHHKHHRIEVKGILHTSGKKKHHKHHKRDSQS